jgi:DNA modification methylase
VLDPFTGSGNAGVAACALGREFIGIDVSATYLAYAEEKLSAVDRSGFMAAAHETVMPNPPQDLPMTDVG